jgi:spore coat polysaccharide biosynthesis predicted glycosyltransferase SpsG
MRIAFRAEGNHRQGMGDIWGAIALADEFVRSDDEARFFLSGGEEAREVIARCGYQAVLVDDLAAELGALQAYRPDVIVVNKLKNDPAYLQRIRERCGFLVTMDDDGAGAGCADLNVNVLYPIPKAVTDPEYIALRREFQVRHEEAKPIRNVVGELLITQGGSDTHGFTPRIVRALEQMAARPHCTVVVGPAFRHDDELREAVKSSTLDLSIVRNARNMAEVMWHADLAVTAGGLTMFELACVGTPSLVVCGERFEVPTAARIERVGAVINLGFGGELDYDRLPEMVGQLAADPSNRSRMSARGKEFVDGRGCERIVRLIRERRAALGGCRS